MSEELAGTGDISGVEPEAVVEPSAEQVRRMFKLKDGDIEEEVDEDELVKRASKASAAQRRFEDAARQQEEAQSKINQAYQVLNMLKTNPAGVMRHLGMGHDQIMQMAEGIIHENLQDKMMTPEEKARRQNDELAKRWRDREDSDRKAKEEAERQSNHQANMKFINDGLFAAMQRANILTGDNNRNFALATDAVKYLAHEAQLAQKENRKPNLDFDQAVQKATYMHRRAFRTFVDALPPEDIIRLLGPEKVKALRQLDVQNNQKIAPNVTKAQNQTRTPKKQESETKYMNEREWMDSLKR